MGDTLDRLVGTAGKVANDAVKATGKLVDKGRNMANQMALQARLAKLQKQLGSLVYALRKNEEENEPMITWYVAEIDRIKAKLVKLEKDGDSFTDNVVVFDGRADGAESDKDAMFRGGGE